MEQKKPRQNQMSVEGVRQPIEFRRMHGLLPHNSNGGRPVHEEPGRYGSQDMSGREKEVLICAGPSVCLQGRSYYPQFRCQGPIDISTLALFRNFGIRSGEMHASEGWIIIRNQCRIGLPIFDAIKYCTHVHVRTISSTCHG